jgi:hypothetical protein
MTFQYVVANTPTLVGSLRPGLGALVSRHAAQVDCCPTRRLRGSVFLDPVLATARPNRPSWDYAIGWKSRSGPECAFFAEVHPANSAHVMTVIQKKLSVVSWMRQDAPLLLGLAAETERVLSEGVFHWLATDSGVAIRPGSRQSRMLQQEGISGPKRRLVLQ